MHPREKTLDQINIYEYQSLALMIRKKLNFMEKYFSEEIFNQKSKRNCRSHIERN